MKLFFRASVDCSAVITATGAWDPNTRHTATVAATRGENNATLVFTAPAHQISLWWPRGLGQQVRYLLTASVAAGREQPISTSRSIGFRCGISKQRGLCMRVCVCMCLPVCVYLPVCVFGRKTNHLWCLSLSVCIFAGRLHLSPATTRTQSM